MLSLGIFVAAEKLRQSLGERHFGHFDRDAVFLHGSCENEAEQIPAANATRETGKSALNPNRCLLTCTVEPDPTSGNLTPQIRPS